MIHGEQDRRPVLKRLRYVKGQPIPQIGQPAAAPDDEETLPPPPLPDAFSLTTVSVASLLWLGLALCLDRFAFAPLFPRIAELGVARLHFGWPSGEFNLPPINMLLLLGVPCVVLALCGIPRHEFRKRSGWIKAMDHSSRGFFWLFVWFALIALSQLAFVGVHRFLPEGFLKVAEMFKLTGSLSVLKSDLAKVNGNLFAAAGFVVGGWLFLTRGVRQTLNALFPLFPAEPPLPLPQPIESPGGWQRAGREISSKDLE